MLKLSCVFLIFLAFESSLGQVQQANAVTASAVQATSSTSIDLDSVGTPKLIFIIALVGDFLRIMFNVVVQHMETHRAHTPVVKKTQSISEGAEAHGHDEAKDEGNVRQAQAPDAKIIRQNSAKEDMSIKHPGKALATMGHHASQFAKTFASYSKTHIHEHILFLVTVSAFTALIVLNWAEGGFQMAAVMVLLLVRLFGGMLAPMVAAMKHSHGKDVKPEDTKDGTKKSANFLQKYFAELMKEFVPVFGEGSDPEIKAVRTVAVVLNWIVLLATGATFAFVCISVKS